MTSIRIIPNIGNDDGKTYPTNTPLGIVEMTPSERRALLLNPPDWRINNHYPTHKPCCICGSTIMIGLEPRFGYPVCKLHSKLSPVEVGKQRTDWK